MKTPKLKLIVYAICFLVTACSEPVKNAGTDSVGELSSRPKSSPLVSSPNGNVASVSTLGDDVAKGSTTAGNSASGSTTGGNAASGSTTGGNVNEDDIVVLTSSPTLSIKQVQLCKRIVSLDGEAANNAIEILLPNYSFKDFIFRGSEIQLQKRHVNLVCPRGHKTKNAFKIEQVIFPDRILRTLDQHKDSDIFIADGKFTAMSVSRGKIAIGKLYLSRFAKFSFND